MAVTAGRFNAIPRDLSGLLAFATASHARAAAFLVFVCVVAFLPGFFNTPPVDRDEARFAQATKQMLESGDYIDIRFQDEVRYKKPVGIYWLQAGVVRTAEALGVPEARTAIWLYRLPSLAGAVGAVLLTYWTALAFVGRRHAYLAGLIMATSILLNVEARLAKTDAMLLFTIVAAMGVLARAYLATQKGEEQGGWTYPAIFWTALAGGILLKGPLILMVVGLALVTLAIFDRSLRWFLPLKPAIGIVWMLALVLPWFLAITGRAGDSFFVESVGQDLFGKVISAQETHGAPPGYYLLLFWLTFWPGAPMAAVAAPSVWRHRRDVEVRFLLAWAVPSWIVLELVITKLPHYVLPLYPAIAILIARAIERRELSDNPHLTRTTLMWPVFTVLIPVAAIVALIALRGQLGLLAWPFAAAGMIFGFLAWRLYAADGPQLALVRATTAAYLMMIAVFGVVVPLLRPLFPSPVLASVVRNLECPSPVVVAAGFHEPSLVFLVGTQIRLVDGVNAAEILRQSLRQGRCGYALIEARHERAFAQRAELIGLRYTLRWRENAFNTNGGRAISIAVFRSEPL
jgi:4-amino-4-deoxy-L-arabinose transferase-like glycosyltransferase